MFLKNQSRWKAVILDLDGTLLHSDGSISEYTLEMLQECKRRGILVIIATARFWFKAENITILFHRIMQYWGMERKYITMVR